MPFWNFYEIFQKFLIVADHIVAEVDVANGPKEMLEKINNAIIFSRF